MGDKGALEAWVLMSDNPASLPVSPLTIINICEFSIAFIRQKIKKKKKKLGGAQWENTLFPKIRN